MQMRMIIALIFTWAAAAAHAGEAPGGAQVYVDADQYVAAAFDGAIPDLGTVWPGDPLRQHLRGILGHNPALRYKYWRAAGRTVWVLDEIGKDRPITAGITIKDGEIEDIRVLVFRESRGWEVKYDFFTRQFRNLRLDSMLNLSSHVDNITGATLSVNAMNRMARAALLLHEHANQTTPALANAR